MIKYIFILLIFSIKTFSQKKELLGHTYIVAPDKNTYADIKILSFEEEDVLTVSSFMTKEKVKYSYKIENGELILNDSITYGRMKYFNRGFKIFDVNNKSINYIKLEKTEFKGNLKNINKINNSCWKTISETVNESFCINKEKNKIIKVSNTYILLISNQWVFPIKKITDKKIYLLNPSPNKDKILLIKRVKE